MNKTIKKFNDAFGNVYEEEILPREEIEKQIKKLDWEEIIRDVVESQLDNFTSVVYLDLRDGKIVKGRYASNQDEIRGEYLVTLYVLEPDVFYGETWDWEDLLNPEEYKIFMKRFENENSQKILQDMGINFKERLANHLYDVFSYRETMEFINEQLDRIYGDLEV